MSEAIQAVRFFDENGMAVEMVDQTARNSIANLNVLTPAKITALDNMFKAGAYASVASAEYAAFREAFGIVGQNLISTDYSTWKTWGSGISVIDNGFSVDSPEMSYSAGVGVGFLTGTYGDYKNKTIKISVDVGGEFTTSVPGAGVFAAYIRHYTAVPESAYTENSTGFTRIPPMLDAGHSEYTLSFADATWEGDGGTPDDSELLGLQFYVYCVGTITATNFLVEEV